MQAKVKGHPEYPFSEVNLEASLLEIGDFISDPPMGATERGEILEFVRLTRQYAFLEKLIQGEILFDLPVHMEVLSEEPMPPLAQAEAMAREEYEILELGIEPGVVLAEALDNRGIKVFFRSRGPEPRDVLNGAFHYMGETGPSLLASAALNTGDAAFVLAHEYGHLVMDVNPYRSRFCRWRRSDLANVNPTSVEEDRADRFARALLVPDRVLAGIGPEFDIAKVASILGVSPAVVWGRLGDLGLQRLEIPPLADPGEGEREIDEKRPTDLPERFVNLALAAYASRVLETADLSRFLRVPPERLSQFLSWSQIPRDTHKEDAALSADEDEKEFN
jgi:Zn-dependent peptidase ImmA (M78 family)